MNTQVTDLDAAEFSRFFTDFEHTAYRLETLQRYDVAEETESFAAFLAGNPDPFGLSETDWTETIRAAGAAGKVMRRVHVVEEPLTDYLRYEMAGYRRNVDAGEDVRILPVQSGRWPELPRRDYWLFDSRYLWFMDYDHEGRFLGAVRATDSTEIVMGNWWRDAAVHAAVPYGDYIRRS